MQAKIRELEAQLNSKNSYMNNFRSDDIVAAATQAEQDEEHNPRGFDKVFDMDAPDERTTFAPKQRMKGKTAPKDAFISPMTTAQSLGWREPYDNLTSGQHNRSGMCKRTFADNGHLWAPLCGKET